MLAEVLVKVLAKGLAILSKKKYWLKYWQYFLNEEWVSVLAILSKSIVNNPGGYHRYYRHHHQVH